ncbi:MAG: thioredoxin family protein [Bacteroidetes bacterium]|nr:thioredoxin family protein [Bacteroidota bacterium]
MIEINFTNAKLIQETPQMLISFWAPWCSACAWQNQLLQKLEPEIGDLIFASIDVNDNRYLAQQFSVTRVPELLLLKKGEVIKRINTVINQVQLLNEIKKSLL